MQDARTAPRRGLYAAALALLVAAVAALSSWVAADPAPAQSGATPNQAVQTPEGSQGERSEGERPGRPPCPEKERGGGDSSEGESTATPAI